MVTTPEPTSITDAYTLLKALSRHDRFSAETTKIKVLSNRVDTLEEGRTLFAKLNAVVSRYLKLPIEYLGAIPQDQELSRSVMQQMPVSINSPKAISTKAYEEIAAILMNKEIHQSVPKRGMAAFFSHIVAGKKSV